MKRYLFTLGIFCTVSLFAVGLLLLGCSPRKQVNMPPASKEKAPYRVEQEGKVPPLNERDIKKQPDIEEIPVPDDQVDVQEMKPKVDSTFVVEKAPKKPLMQGGYRIQVFASASSVSAEEVQQEVEKEFSIPAYVTFIDGMYKVRIGDFILREEAERFLSRCKASGYSDAWITKCLVNAGGTQGEQ